MASHACLQILVSPFLFLTSNVSPPPAATTLPLSPKLWVTPPMLDQARVPQGRMLTWKGSCHQLVVAWVELSSRKMCFLCGKVVLNLQRRKHYMQQQQRETCFLPSPTYCVYVYVCVVVYSWHFAPVGTISMASTISSLKVFGDNQCVRNMYRLLLATVP